MRFKLLRSGATLLALLFLTQVSLPLSAKAQEPTSTVKGIVHGAKKEPLTGVSVIIRNSKTNFTTGTNTDSAGVFTFLSVPAGGPYSFSFSIVGYEPQTLSGYTIK